MKNYCKSKETDCDFASTYGYCTKINCVKSFYSYKPFVVSDLGIMKHSGNGTYEIIIPKEVFVEAVNKYYLFPEGDNK